MISLCGTICCFYSVSAKLTLTRNNNNAFYSLLLDSIVRYKYTSKVQYIHIQTTPAATATGSISPPDGAHPHGTPSAGRDTRRRPNRPERRTGGASWAL